jgi:hypothetical protein
MAFYDLSETERMAMTEKAMAERRTVMERWAALDNPEAQPWNERAARVARLLQGCASVADLGCGNMQLEPHLAEGTAYYPVDVVARDSRTLVVDFNREGPPALDVEGWATIGLLEYLYDVPALLKGLSGTLVATYNPVDLAQHNRRGHAWVNDWSTQEVEAMFHDTGWTIVERETFGGQQIWKLTR